MGRFGLGGRRLAKYADRLCGASAGAVTGIPEITVDIEIVAIYSSTSEGFLESQRSTQSPKQVHMKENLSTQLVIIEPECVLGMQGNTTRPSMRQTNARVCVNRSAALMLQAEYVCFMCDGRVIEL